MIFSEIAVAGLSLSSLARFAGGPCVSGDETASAKRAGTIIPLVAHEKEECSLSRVVLARFVGRLSASGDETTSTAAGTEGVVEEEDSLSRGSGEVEVFGWDENSLSGRVGTVEALASDKGGDVSSTPGMAGAIDLLASDGEGGATSGEGMAGTFELVLFLAASSASTSLIALTMNFVSGRRVPSYFRPNRR